MTDKTLVERLRERQKFLRERGGDYMTLGEGEPLLEEAATELSRLSGKAGEYWFEGNNGVAYRVLDKCITSPRPGVSEELTAADYGHWFS